MDVLDFITKKKNQTRIELLKLQDIIIKMLESLDKEDNFATVEDITSLKVIAVKLEFDYMFIRKELSELKLKN